MLQIVRQCGSIPLRLARYSCLLSRQLYSTSSDIGHNEHTCQVYLDNVFPLRAHWLDPRFLFFRRMTTSAVTSSIKTNCLPPTLPYSAQVVEVIPRLRDGGAIVEIVYTAADGAQGAHEIIAAFQQHLRQSPKQWFNGVRNKAHLVKGQPFLADMAGQNPNRIVKVEFRGVEYNAPVPIEALYTMFRPYGNIYDIVVPKPSADTIRHATIRYTRTRSAAIVHNVLYNAVLEAPELHGGKRIKVNFGKPTGIISIIVNYASSHPRVFIPLFFAALLGGTYVVFDPVRRFMIRRNVTNTTQSEWMSFLLSRTQRLMSLWKKERSQVDAALGAFWEGHEDVEDKLRQWIAEPPSTFIVLTGPGGSGKTELVGRVLKDKKWRVWIDCEALGQARNEDDLLTRLANQVGYWPVFSILIKLSNLTEALVTFTTGTKTGMSTNAHAQMLNILESTALALDSVDGHPTMEHGGGLHGYKSKRRAHEHDPGQFDEYPVVVIDGFVWRDGAQHDQLWTDLAEWAALLVDKRVAHVVVIGRNAGSVARPLTKALPNRSLNIASLQDGTTDAAMRYVLRRLSTLPSDDNDGEKNNKQFVLDDLEECVTMLGGRLTDLEIFIQKIMGGVTPRQAITDLVQRASREIRKQGLLDDEKDTTNQQGWTAEQFWHIMVSICQYESIAYDAIRNHRLFSKDGDYVLRAMERADLIQLLHRDGRPYAILPGKPLHLAAYRRMMRDGRLVGIMEKRRLSAIRKLEMAYVEQFENEMKEISTAMMGIRDSSVIKDKETMQALETRFKNLGQALKSKVFLIQQLDQGISEASASNKDLDVEEEVEDELVRSAF